VHGECQPVAIENTAFPRGSATRDARQNGIACRDGDEKRQAITHRLPALAACLRATASG
jgi:hypothetical protein